MKLAVNEITKPLANNSLEKVKNIGTKVVEKIAPEPVQKKAVSVMDKMFFVQYMFARNLSLKTTNDEIKKLFELNGDEFLHGAYDFLLKKMGVPESLRPQIVSVPQNENIGMAYNFITNQLILNPNNKKNSNLEIYGFLRHEFQHLLQNIDIFRNLEIKDDVIDLYTKKAIEMNILNIKHIVKNLSIEQLNELGCDEGALNFYKELKEIYQNGGEEKLTQTLNELAEESIPDFKNKFSAFSDLVIKEMGPLKQGSREASRSVKFFKEYFNDSSYWKPNGSIHLGKYVTDVRENEALISQEIAISDAKAALENEKSCYIQRIKKDTDTLTQQINNNEQGAQEIVESSKEILDKSSLKEFLDYLFN